LHGETIGVPSGSSGRKFSAQFDRRQPLDRSVTALAINPASPAPSLPCRELHHAVALRATALSPSLPPSRQHRPLLLACFLACCPPPAPSASLMAPSATSTPGCSLCSIAPRPAGSKSQAIEHNSALPKATAPPAAKLLPAWAAARPAGSGNGLLCLAPPVRPTASFGATRWVAYAQPCGRAYAPVARSLAGYAGQSVGGCRPASADFCRVTVACRNVTPV
jgi:hypothetical protein